MKNLSIRNYPEVKKSVYKVGHFAGIAGNVNPDELNLGYTAYACNARLGGGSLFRAQGVDVARFNGVLLPSGVTVGSTISKAIVYKRRNASTGTEENRLVINTTGGGVYEAKIGVDTSFTKINVPSVSVEMLNFNDGTGDLLVCYGADGNVSSYDGTTIKTATGPKLTGLTVYNGRVFGAEKGSNKLRCSEKNNPLGWTSESKGAFSVTFPDEGGEVKRAVPCGENLYVFRDYAVYKLTGYTDRNEYALTKIFYSQNPIYPDTVGVNGEKVYFLAEDGFFEIKNGSVGRTWRDEALLIEDKTYASGTCYNGTYYVAAKLYTDGTGDVGDETHCVKNNGIVGIEADTGAVTAIRGADVKSFLPCFIDGKSYLFLVNSAGYRGMNLSMFTPDGKIYGTVPQLRWYSPTITLGRRGEDKTIRRINVLARTDMTLGVASESGVKTFALTGSLKTQTVAVNLRCERAGITVVSSSPDFALDGFEVEYETTERRSYGAN